MIGWGLNAPITWSIDTSTLRKPKRARDAAIAAFKQWTPTGHVFTYTEADGDIGIIFHQQQAGWGAYGQWTAVVPATDGWRITKGAVVMTNDETITKKWLFSAMAHEVGHALGLGHLGPKTVMGSPSRTDGVVTKWDINAEKKLQRPY